MKKNVLCLLLGGILCAGAATWAHSPSASPSPQVNRAELEDIVQQLGLTPRQKIAVARILRDAKASGQDKAVTAEQIGAQLNPDQKKILMDAMMQKAAEKKAGQ